jgi:hypothetical protein
MSDAVKLCFEREPSFVQKYVETAFTLDSDPARTSSRVSTNGASGTADEDDETVGETEGESWVESSDDVDTADTDDAPTQSRSRRRKRRGIMERFASSRGYVSQGHGAFEHPDGRKLVHTSEAFPWQEYDQAGELMQQYWVKEHCLDLKPLEIDAAVWNLLESDPERSSLVLASRRGTPMVMPGSRVVRMKSKGDLRLYPATYRIRLERVRAKGGSVQRHV